MARRKETFAFIQGHGWFVVDRATGSLDDGLPWFIGTGIGFDINRLLVYTDNKGDAEEIAEEKWPDRMGDKLSRKEEEEAEDNGEATFFAKGRMWSYKETRIFQVAKFVEKGTPMGGGDARLVTGEMIRYT